MKSVVLLIFFALMNAQAQNSSSVKLPAKEKLQIYLLMGQSNMAGRGVVEEEDTISHSRVFLFTQSNQWELAVEPVTRGEKGKTPGVGPSLAFGKAIAKARPSGAIGLVPCAVGGTPLKRWERGADLYSNAVVRAKAAAEFGTIAGILWHQGEADSRLEENAKSYGERLEKMIRDIREDLDAPRLPFVVGQIGEFIYTLPGNPRPYARDVNETLAKIPLRVPYTSCALSEGLGHKGDQLHFSSESQRELGRRYAKEMLNLKKSPKERRAESERKLFRR